MPSLTVERQEDPKDIAEGHYARKQLRCKSRIIAWSHEARFRMAVSLAVSHARGKLLDYGCGDGTFLTMGEETHSSNSFAKARQEYSRWYAGGSNVSRNDDIFINHRSYHFSAVSLCERRGSPPGFPCPSSCPFPSAWNLPSFSARNRVPATESRLFVLSSWLVVFYRT